jgi:peptidoglycan-associated lipoprotein
MHRHLNIAGLVAVVTLVNIGCGGRTQPETPEPMNQETPSVEPTYVPSTVTSEPISDKGISSSQRATLEERISFAFDQWELSSDAREKLSAKAEVLRDHPELSLRIEGHADERGSDEYNLALSNRRSAAAMRFLINQGITTARLASAGYGEEQPLDPAENESAWARNRRAEFRVTTGNLAQQ